MFERNDGKWEEISPEAGSFVAPVVEALNAIYNISSSGGSVVGAALLNKFNNDNNNVTFLNLDDGNPSHHNGNTIIGKLNITDKLATTKGFQLIDFFIAIGHELGHAISFNLIEDASKKYILV